MRLLKAAASRPPTLGDGRVFRHSEQLLGSSRLAGERHQCGGLSW